MEPLSGVSTSPAPPDTKLGLVLRVCFFAATVYIALSLFARPIYLVFGLVAAGTISLGGAGVFANALTMRIFDRRPFADIGLRLTRQSGVNLLIGFILGAGTAALMLAAPLVAGTGHFIAKTNSEFAWSSLIFYLFALLLAAAGEEMIFRGYAFQLLIERIGPFATILPVGVIFGFFHAMNPSATKLSVTNTVLWGILLGYSFLRSHDLWLPLGLHYGWNVVLPLFGVNLSGLTIDVTGYSYRWDLLPLWTGGNYGPEGGLLATIFVVALFFALAKAPVRRQTAAIARSLNDW